MLHCVSSGPWSRRGCLGLFLLCAWSVALVAPPPCDAAPRSVTLEPVWNVGDRFQVSHGSVLEMTLAVAVEGRVETIQIVNDDQFQLSVEVDQVDDERLRRSTLVVQEVLRKATPRGGGPAQELLRTTQPQQFVARWGRDGTLVELRGLGGAAALAPDSPEAALTREVLDSAVDTVRCEAADFGVGGLATVGSSWTITRSLFLGGGGRVQGASTLDRVELIDGREVAVLKVQLEVQEEHGQLGGAMLAHLEGTVRIPLATGRCSAVLLEGPITLEAKLGGVPMTGSGRLSIRSDWR